MFSFKVYFLQLLKQNFDTGQKKKKKSFYLWNCFMFISASQATYKLLIRVETISRFID